MINFFSFIKTLSKLCVLCASLVVLRIYDDYPLTRFGQRDKRTLKFSFFFTKRY